MSKTKAQLVLDNQQLRRDLKDLGKDLKIAKTERDELVKNYRPCIDLRKQLRHVLQLFDQRAKLLWRTGNQPEGSRRARQEAQGIQQVLAHMQYVLQSPDCSPHASFQNPEQCAVCAGFVQVWPTAQEGSWYASCGCCCGNGINENSARQDQRDRAAKQLHCVVGGQDREAELERDLVAQTAECHVLEEHLTDLTRRYQAAQQDKNHQVQQISALEGEVSSWEDHIEAAVPADYRVDKSLEERLRGYCKKLRNFQMQLTVPAGFRVVVEQEPDAG